MIGGIVAAAAPVNVQAVPAVLWTPLNMTTVPQIYLDAQDSVITNVGGTCSLISNLGAMGSDGDFSQTTTGRRPGILESDINGRRALKFDGSDDRMQGGSIAQKALFQSASAAWSFAVLRKRGADSSNVTRVIFSASQGASTGSRFVAGAGLGIPGSVNNPYFAASRLDGGSSASLAAGQARSGSYYTAMQIVGFQSGEGSIYLDGELLNQNTSLVSPTGLTSNTPSQQPLFIGCFPNQAAGFADIDLATLIISNTEVSASDRAKLEGWAAHKYGLTANLPAGHPYKTAAPTV